MKVLASVFSLLGIGLHIRMLGFLFDSEHSANFAFMWDTASFANRALTVGSMILPFAFYGVCIGACFTKIRMWWMTLVGGAICLLAVPYFTHLHAELPSVAKNSFMAAMFAIPHYLAKPKGGDNSAANQVETE